MSGTGDRSRPRRRHRAHSAMTSARTTGPSRAITSLVDSDRLVIPTTVPVVSFTTPPGFTALRVFHVAVGSATRKGMTPHATTATAGTTTRARSRQAGTATTTATRGR